MNIYDDDDQGDFGDMEKPDSMGDIADETGSVEEPDDNRDQDVEEQARRHGWRDWFCGS